MEWKEVKLGELIEIFDYQRIPLSSTEREKRKGIYPYYGAQGIIDSVDGYIFDGEYILIAEDGNNVKTRQENITQIANGKFWVNNHAHIVKGKINQQLLCFIINNTDISGFVTDSAQPKLNQANLVNIPVKIPSKEIQEKASSILSSLDSKIETNNKINKKLEEMAQALFKSWFVDFEPFKDGEMVESELGMIPKGWKVGKLGNICRTNKRSLSAKCVPEEMEYLDTGNITNNKIDNVQILHKGQDKIPSRAKRLVEEGDIIFSTVRPNQRHFGLLMNPSSKLVVSTGFAVITSNWSGYRYYIYQLLTQDSIISTLQNIAEQSVSTYPSVNASDIEDLTIVIPTMEDTCNYAAASCNLYQKVETNNLENSRLSTLRDTLLPKLMSGEINLD